MHLGLIEVNVLDKRHLAIYNWWTILHPEMMSIGEDFR